MDKAVLMSAFLAKSNLIRNRLIHDTHDHYQTEGLYKHALSCLVRKIGDVVQIIRQK